MVRVKHGPLRSPVSKLVPQKVLRGSELAQAQLQFARAGRDGDNAIPEITLPGIDSAHLDLVRRCFFLFVLLFWRLNYRTGMAAFAIVDAESMCS